MIKEKLREILENLQIFESDADKCENGNASAGRRLRKACMEATKELKALRATILEKIK